MDQFTIDPSLVMPAMNLQPDNPDIVMPAMNLQPDNLDIVMPAMDPLPIDLDIAMAAMNLLPIDLDIAMAAMNLLPDDLDTLMMDLKVTSTDIDFHISRDLFDLDLSLLDFGHEVDLDRLPDCYDKCKRPRGRQLQYERNYRNNQKRERERRLSKWIHGEMELQRLTANRDAVPSMPEGGDPTPAQRVCQLVFEEQAILHDTLDMRALLDLSKGLDILDWKRGVLIPGCKRDDLKELTERRTTFVFHWERGSLPFVPYPF